jgi:hypothetical protein
MTGRQRRTFCIEVDQAISIGAARRKSPEKARNNERYAGVVLA